MNGIARKRQRYNLTGVKRLNFPIQLEAQHGLRAPEILPFQDPAIFQFQSVCRSQAHKKQPQRKHSQEAI